MHTRNSACDGRTEMMASDCTCEHPQHVPHIYERTVLQTSDGSYLEKYEYTHSWEPCSDCVGALGRCLELTACLLASCNTDCTSQLLIRMRFGLGITAPVSVAHARAARARVPTAMIPAVTGKFRMKRARPVWRSCMYMC